MHIAGSAMSGYPSIGCSRMSIPTRTGGEKTSQSVTEFQPERGPSFSLRRTNGAYFSASEFDANATPARCL